MDKRRKGVREAAGRWERHRVRFEAFLEGLVFSEEPRLQSIVEAMRYSLFGGG